MERCVIVGGGIISEYSKISSFLQKNDFCIFCDCGLRHAEKLGIKPDLIVGDFDSYENPGSGDTETIVLPCEKDDTDTVFGTKEGLRRGYSEFILIGMTGKRLDHTLGNISILLKLDSLGKKGKIVDDYSEMEIVSSKTFVTDNYSSFSLISISGTAKGINIKDAKYPLTDAEITTEYQYGISNEVIPGKTAEISLTEGKLLLIKNF